MREAYRGYTIVSLIREEWYTVLSPRGDNLGLCYTLEQAKAFIDRHIDR